MVPVLDKNKQPLMPCSEKRARLLMERKQAKGYYKQGVFCIILQKEPSNREYQQIVVGIDTGSKREGYTVATKKSVVLNILTDTPNHVKTAMETRKRLRKSRRQRKTPYRKCRHNRKQSGIPPSTRARWQAKLRILNFMKKIIPITDINIEDIKAASKLGDRFWNVNFSPLEVGKNWAYSQIERLDLKLHKTFCHETQFTRINRGFEKSSEKLQDIWEAHNVDSHVLCELVIGSIEPFRGINKIDFFRFHRRQLHEQIPKKKGFRRVFGGTVSLGLARGCLVIHPIYGKNYVGGTMEGKITLCDMHTRKRITRYANILDCKKLTILKWNIKNLRPT
jgi:hypothetical protein